MFRTKDGGATWQQVLNNPNKCLALTIDSACPRTVYVGTGAGLFKSLDGGDSWVSLNGLGTDQITGLGIAPNGTVYAGTQNGLYRSTDAGQTWLPTESGTILYRANRFAFDPRSPSFAYATASADADGTTGGVYMTTDGGT